VSALLIAGAVAAVLAALIHVLIFAFESVLWRRERVWRRFGVASQAEADTVQPMAYNQGYYNLFLAIGVGLGLTLWLSGAEAMGAGIGITLFALASMLLASVVLVTSSPSLARAAAATQGALPLVAIALLVLSLVTG
jgi:putative membrane protein